MSVAGGLAPAWNGRHGGGDGSMSVASTGKVSVILPGELSDTVVDFLHDDKDSLRQCSLVCKAWLSSSRLHLFNTITVRDAERTFEQLQPFLAAIPSSASAIHHLIFSGQATLTIDEVQVALCSLPGLRELKLVDCTILAYRTDRRRPTPCFSHVSALRIIHCNTTADDLDPLLDLIALFSNIDYLALQNNNFKFLKAPRESGPGLSATSLRTISAVMVPLSLLSCLILQSKTPAEIKRVELVACTVRSYRDDGAAPFAALLAAIMPTLESFGVTPGLYFMFDERHVLAGTAESYAISRCAHWHLQSLDILLPKFADMQQLMKLMLSFTYDFRMRALPPVVRAVRFVVPEIASVEEAALPRGYTAQKHEEEVAFYWLYIDHNFECTEFAGRTFEIVMADDASPASRARVAALKAYLEKRLAVMVRRGQLTIFPGFSG
ncbi:hypothetical protein OH76DRAFT_1094686 [Lentinus brumalis]|uniref:F-box domain-containing protein n=1 Tax=Lentinus brumalis TaxID=2498619 RepID=A0A371CW17_9APHY|nr:hypothetical protein OH76DRAFT_1094686 [Polyporus brumalis]